METRPRIHILERREVVILTLLSMVGGALLFTAGLHMGKRLQIPASQDEILDAPEPGSVKTVPDSIPNRQDLTEQGRVAPEAADEAMRDALQSEVQKTDAKLDHPRQTDLPTDAKTKSAGKTQLTTEVVSAHSATIFTLQVGSYPTDVEAQALIQKLEGKGLEPFLRSVDLSGKGQWYRIYVGRYSSKEEAEKDGLRMRAKQVVSTFIVAKLAE